MGATHVIDYARENFTEGDRRYDLILDCVGNHSLLDQRRVLKPGGKIVIIGGPSDDNWIGPLLGPITATILSPFVSEEFIMLLAEINTEDLATLANLMQASEVTPVIDRKYPLRETAKAIAYLEKGHARGKVVVTLD